MSVTTAAASLRRPRDAMAIACYSVVVWLLETLMFAFVLPVFGMKFGLAASAVTMSVTNLGILVPSSPGFIGSFHFFCAQALMAQGVLGATAMAYALVVHLTFFVPVTLWGAGAILWYGIQVGATAALARAAKAVPAAATVDGVAMHILARLAPSRVASHAPSAFDVALTETFVTTTELAADPVAVHVAATFLSEQIGALPSRLRLLYAIGIAVFRAWVRVTQRTGFCLLSADRRRAAVYPWAFGRITPLRQLFRPVRSTVLLAYYDCAGAGHELTQLAPVSIRSATATLGDHEARGEHG